MFRTQGFFLTLIFSGERVQYRFYRKEYTTMKEQSYESYLRSSHWKNKKKEYEDSEKVKFCVICANKKYILHHLSYKNLGNEPLEDFLSVCDSCHGSIHAYLRLLKLPVEQTYEVIPLIEEDRGSLSVIKVGKYYPTKPKPKNKKHKKKVLTKEEDDLSRIMKIKLGSGVRICIQATQYDEVIAEIRQRCQVYRGVHINVYTVNHKASLYEDTMGLVRNSDTGNRLKIIQTKRINSYTPVRTLRPYRKRNKSQ
jgi:hypothetical protein